MTTIVVHGGPSAAIGSSLGAVGEELLKGLALRRQQQNEDKRTSLFAERQGWERQDRAEANALGGAEADRLSGEIDDFGRQSSALAQDEFQQSFAQGMQHTGSPLMAGVRGAAAAAQAMPVDPQEFARAKELAQSLKDKGYPQAAAKLLHTFGESVKGRIADREEAILVTHMQQDLARAIDGPMGPQLQPVVQGISSLLQAAKRAPASQRAQIINQAMRVYAQGLSGARKQYQFDQEKLHVRNYVTQVGAQLEALPASDPRHQQFQQFAAWAETAKPDDVYERGFLIANDMVKLGDGRFMPRTQWLQEREADLARKDAELKVRERNLDRLNANDAQRVDENAWQRDFKERQQSSMADYRKTQTGIAQQNADTAQKRAENPPNRSDPDELKLKDWAQQIADRRRTTQEILGGVHAAMKPSDVEEAKAELAKIRGTQAPSAAPSAPPGAPTSLTPEQQARFDKLPPEEQEKVRKERPWLFGGK